MSYGDHRTFEVVSRVSKERCYAWHPEGLEEWSPTDWSNAAAGEMGELGDAVIELALVQLAASAKLGELCNTLKKLRRLDGGTERVGRGSHEQLLKQIAQEIGDTYIYLDLTAQRLGLDMYDCIRDTFNRVSEREDLPQRLGL